MLIEKAIRSYYSPFRWLVDNEHFKVGREGREPGELPVRSKVGGKRCLHQQATCPLINARFSKAYLNASNVLILHWNTMMYVLMIF